MGKLYKPSEWRFRDQIAEDFFLTVPYSFQGIGSEFHVGGRLHIGRRNFVTKKLFSNTD